jgi:hypothetical protein
MFQNYHVCGTKAPQSLWNSQFQHAYVIVWLVSTCFLHLHKIFKHVIKVTSGFSIPVTPIYIWFLKFEYEFN